MKKVLSVLLVLCLCLSVFPTVALAAEEDFVIENGVLTDYNGPSGDVVIPNGVTSIGYQAFFYCTSLTSVTIPDSVTSIGEHAFEGCSSLKSVTIPDSVTSIGEHAFYGCTGLTSVTIPNGVTSIEEHAFYGCTGLTSVTIPNGVTSIEECAFYNCTSLTSVTIPGSVTTIERCAFYNCTSLTSVTIPNGVTSISESAFSGCTGLTSVTIPGSVTEIGQRAFSGCAGLTSVTIPSSVNTISEEAFKDCTGLTSVTIPNSVKEIKGENGYYSYNREKRYGAFYGCTNLATAFVPTTTEVGKDAFPSATKITLVGHDFTIDSKGVLTGYRGSGGDITIPDGVTRIGASALSAYQKDGYYSYKYVGPDYGITSVTIPKGVTSIGEGALYGCKSLTSVTIPKGVTSIEKCAFYNCTGLTSVTIPDSVTSIGEGAFNFCTNLATAYVPSTAALESHAFPDETKIIWVGHNFYINNKGVLTGYRGPGGDITIPDGVTSIGSLAFSAYSQYSTYSSYERARSDYGITSVTIPDSVTSIGQGAFYGCDILASVTMGSGVTKIEKDAFSNCKRLTRVTMGSGVTDIGAAAFADCTGLTGVTIPSSVKKISNQAFRGCTGLTGVTIPGSVTDMEYNAFSGCTSLTSVTFSGGVTEIADHAFQDCTNLASVTIPSSVTYIGNFAFSGCTRLSAASVPSTAKVSPNAFPSTTKVTLVGYNFTVKDGVLTDYNGPADNIVIPNNVAEIRGGFAGRTDITGVTISNSVTKIGDSAFRASGLTSVTIPDNVTYIGSKAFENCTSLTSVTIGSNVATIGSSAFAGCAGLTAVSVPSTAQVAADAFPGTTKVTRTGHNFTVKNGILSAYSGPGGAIVIPEGVTEIKGGFSGRSDITSVTIPYGVIKIDGSAFSNCIGLTSVTIPSSVTYIGGGAFSGCLSLKAVEVSSATQVASGAFPSTTSVNLMGHHFGVTKGVLETYVGPGGDIAIPAGVTSIRAGAFSGRADITSVTIPEGVTELSSCFSGCTNLTSVTIPGSVTAINGTFSGCTNLTSVTIPGSVTTIGDSAFKNCTGLASITIPSGVTKIGGNAFSGCTRLTGITIPNGVTEIGYSAFSRCTGLTSVSVPNSVKTIGGEAFSGCTGLTGVTLGSGLTSLGSDAFANCAGLTSMTIPGSLTKLSGGTFEGCAGLTGVTVQPGVKEVTLYYGDCPNLKRLSLPDSVEKLSVSSNSLREIAIPAGVTSWPTLNCPRLTKLTFPTDNWVFKGISRADFMKNIKSYTALNEVVNCPNEFVADLIAPNKAIQNNWKNPKSTVVSQSGRITSLSNEITAGCATEYDKAKAISQWVVDHIKYDDDYYYAGLKNYSDVPFDAAEVLEKGQAVCAGYARLTQALLVAQGIPCLYVLGWVSDGYHAWNLAYVDGEYIWIDNTWGMKYFGLGVYAISRDHTATGGATFNDVKGPGTLVPGADGADGANAEKSTIGTALPETAEDILAREKIEELKDQYPNGASWNDGNTYYSEGLAATGSGGAGFAYLCSDAAFGKDPASEAGSSFSKVRVGDILRINGDTHWVVVLRKMSDGVIVAEGNYNGMIRWGREISRAELEQGGLKITTRWGTEPSEDTAETTAKGLPADMGTAYPSAQTVSVDGTAVSFQCYALKDANGFDTNYIKLRDLADILNNTAARFQVGWDGSITITTGQSYTKNGSEQNTPFSGERGYTKAFAPTYINGERATLAAFLLNDDAGGGYTYFQLRDLGKALNFNVGWSAERGIYLETDKPYDANN